MGWIRNVQQSWIVYNLLVLIYWRISSLERLKLSIGNDINLASSLGFTILGIALYLDLIASTKRYSTAIFLKDLKF